jgi:hypothetical protein
VQLGGGGALHRLRALVTPHQDIALQHPCRLGCETAHPRFAYLLDNGRRSVVLSVNSGYE